MSDNISNNQHFNQKEFNQYVLEKNIISIKKTFLKSGRISPYYINWRDVVGEAHSGNMLTRYVISFVTNIGLQPKTFLGVKESMSAFGAHLTYEWAKIQSDYGKSRYPVIIERAKPKDNHGDPENREYVGGLPKGKIVVIEDISTTGDSCMETVRKARENGADVIAAIALTNRNEKRDDGLSVEDFYRRNDVKYYPMSNVIDLLPEIYKNRQDGQDFKHDLEEYFKKYGVKELNLSKIPHM
jgi:orotate phosphoribosyltransferase